MKLRMIAGVLALVLAGCGSFLGETSGRDPSDLVATIEEVAYWRAVEDGGDRRFYANYLARYPDGLFAVAARTRLAAGNPASETLSAAEAGGFEAARAYYEPLAWLGGAAAQQRLGEMYLAGWGVAPDLVRAYMWFSLAESQGVSDAGRSRSFTAALMTARQRAAGAALVESFRPAALAVRSAPGVLDPGRPAGDGGP